jgi:hypothetical protein
LHWTLSGKMGGILRHAPAKANGHGNGHGHNGNGQNGSNGKGVSSRPASVLPEQDEVFRIL